MTEQALFNELERKAEWVYDLNGGSCHPSAALTTVTKVVGENEFSRRGRNLPNVYEVTLANVNGPLATYHIGVTGDDPYMWAFAVVESSEATADA